MKKYYNADELLKLNCDINIIDGARGIGKSTDICRRGIQERIATSGQRGGIAYIRRKDKQITKATIESYIKEDMLKRRNLDDPKWYPLSKEYSYLYNYPDNIKPDWKALIEECKQILIDDGIDV